MKRFCRLFVFLSVLSCWMNGASAQVVNIPDPVLASVLRDALDLAPDAPITKSKMQTLYRLNVSNWDIKDLTGDIQQKITDLTGLEHATQLSWLVLHAAHRTEDLRPLSGLEYLTYLELSFGSISDLRPLSGLTRLTHLDLTGNEVHDLAPVKGFTQLKALDVQYNPISDFSPLSGLTQLAELEVSVTSVALMENLRRNVDLTQLRRLSIIGEGNQIGDLRPFANLTQLDYLVVYNAQIRDLTPLAGLTNLTYLGLGVNQIRDLTPLAGLTQLEYLHLNGNQIDNVSPLSGLTNLRTLGLRNNQIRDITPIKDLGANLWLEGNPIGEPPEDEPDLVVESISASRLSDEKREADMTVSPGEEFYLHVTVKIKQTSTSSEAKVLYYRSADDTISDADEMILEGGTVSLAGKDDFSRKLKLKAPQTEGTYYYGVCINSIADESDTENNCSKAIEIRVVRQPGLQISSIPVPVSNAPNRKVHVIWYYPKNEAKRGDARAPFRGADLTDYITPNNVEIHLEDVAAFFFNQLGQTFEFDKSGSTINVHDIKSKKFYVTTGSQSHINKSVDFLDTDGQFFEKLWKDIENEWNNMYPNNLFNDSQNIYLALVQSNYNPPDGLINYGIATVGGGKAMVRLGDLVHTWSDEKVKTVIAHELGHVFGLRHDFSENVIMSRDLENVGGITQDLPELDYEQFSQRSKNWLSVHSDFSNYQFGHISVDSPMGIKVNNQPLNGDPGGFPRGTINLGHLVPDTSTGSPQYTINVQVSDPNGLHQVELIAPMLVNACCGQFYDPEGIALAKYITANNADTSPNVAGYINPSNLTAWTGMIDITKWVEESLERGEDELRLFFTAIDSQGNLFTTHWGSLCISQTLVGDVTGDGNVTVQDLVAVAVAMFDETDKRIRIINIDADVNCDGEVSIKDLVIVAAALHAGAATPAPAALRQQGAAHLTEEEVQHWLTQAQQANLSDATSVRGIRFLKQLLAAFTPKETALLPNYPNPFNPETWIPYQLATPADVTLTIYDIQGRVVRDLDLGHQRAGMYHNRSRAAYWDGRNAVGEPVASGVYFYTLTAGDFSATRKMLILK